MTQFVNFVKVRDMLKLTVTFSVIALAFFSSFANAAPLEPYTTLSHALENKIAIRFTQPIALHSTIDEKTTVGNTFQGVSNAFVNGVDQKSFVHVGDGASCKVTLYSNQPHAFKLPRKFKDGIITGIFPTLIPNTDGTGYTAITLVWNDGNMMCIQAFHNYHGHYTWEVSTIQAAMGGIEFSSLN